MSKAFSKISSGLQDAISYAESEGRAEGFRLHIPADVDVKAIRKRHNLTQEDFALRFGFTLARLRDWEQKRSTPDAPSRLLLKVIENEPEALQRALSAGKV